MHLTQPTVSGMLARLREAFNDPLFIRTSHGLEPTTQALALRSDLERILQDIEMLIQAAPFDPATSTARINLSTNDYMQYVFLAPAVRMLKTVAPNMQFALVQPEIGTLYDKLVNGDIDLAITIPEFSDVKLREQPLYEERYVAVVRKGHQFADKNLTLKRFVELDHGIVSPTDGQFIGPTDIALSKMGKQRQVSVSTSSFFTLIEMVASSDLIALLPYRLAAKFTDRLILKTPPLEVPGFDVILAWHQRSDSDPVRAWLTKMLMQFGEQI